MNKSLRQNWKIFNNLKFYPIGPLEESCPRDKHDAAEWANKQWEHLINDEVTRHAIYVKRGKGTDKYNITVWSDSQVCYLVVCNRTEYNTDSTTVYMQPNTPDNLSDFIKLAKFTHKNIASITAGSVKAHKALQDLKYSIKHPVYKDTDDVDTRA